MGDAGKAILGTVINPGGRDSILPSWAKAVANPIGAATGKDYLQDLSDKATGSKPDEAKAATPPPAPDLTDDEVRRGQMAALRRARMGAGLSSTFLTGPLGDTTKSATAALVKPMAPLGGS